ncbi:transposase, partial [Alkalilimnicola ehrlichii]
MTRPRRSLVHVNDTPYYHCVSRCVRRAFLCGYDAAHQADYSHRRAWVVERLAELSAIFTIDVCAYAVMSNHYHLVLKIDRERAQALSEAAVMQRWARLFNLPLLVERYREQETTTEAEARSAQAIIQTWRERLMDLSWFMRCLNEYLARRANAEDGCTGRFWEGRFKSQALLDEAALLTCMAYVDLNPVRA